MNYKKALIFVLVSVFTVFKIPVASAQFSLPSTLYSDVSLKPPCRLMTPILDGCFTVRDERLFQYLQLLYQTEQIFIEPSASAGFSGLFSVNNHLRAGTHIVWATGGNMVPPQEKDAYLRK